MGDTYVVEEKRVGERRVFLVVVGSCCCVCFGEENLEIKYAIVFHVIVLS